MTTRIRCQAYYVHTVIRITSLRQPTCCSLIIAEFILADYVTSAVVAFMVTARYFGLKSIQHGT